MNNIRTVVRGWRLWRTKDVAIRSESHWLTGTAAGLLLMAVRAVAGSATATPAGAASVGPAATTGPAARTMPAASLAPMARAAPATTAGAAGPAATTAPAAQPESALVCRREKPLDSNIPKQVCRTRAAAQHDAQQVRDVMNRVQQADQGPPMPTG